MTLVKASANPTLKGHKLLLHLPFQLPQALLDPIQADFPDLQIITHTKDFRDGDAYTHTSKEEWKEITVLLTGTALPEPEDAKKLELVQLMSAGANHVLEKPIFKDTDISFCTANGVHGPQISEWVISTFLAYQHRIPQYLDYQREKRWHRHDELPEDSVGKRVGILGYGAIGRQVARVAKAMGMDVHAYTLHPKNTPDERRDETYTPPGLGDIEGQFPSKWFSGGSKADLHAFLDSDLDLLVIAVPLTPKTTHLIGREEFEVMVKKKTFVSNIARGPIVKTDDIIEALNSETIRGAALDVTDPEPLPDGHALFAAKNVIITPHVSGGSTKYGERVLGILRQNLSRLSQGKEFVNRVNRKDGY